uniref:Uncharacterized protein n=1 Tax=Picea sitchensis TaxID=3332 RepID=A0A6B9XSB1_PICSI|nr:hypothetical protein Q903MT_gene6880 [Picea sitchensis]
MWLVCLTYKKVLVAFLFMWSMFASGRSIIDKAGSTVNEQDRRVGIPIVKVGGSIRVGWN